MYLPQVDGNATAILQPLPLHQLDSESLKVLGWNLPSEHLHLVHPHWRGYPAPPFFYHLLLVLIYFALMVTSAFGNGIVIYIFTTSKSLRTPSNVLIVNLAIFDFIMMLEMPMFLANSCFERIVGFELGCNIYAALGSVSGIGAAITNAMIAYDRYKAISSPLDGRLNFVQAGLLVWVTWLWTMPFTIFPFANIWGRYVPEGFLTTCSFDYLTDDNDTRGFVACIFVWAYLLPMILIAFFYARLFKHVCAHEKMLREQAKKMNVKSLSANQDQNATSVEIRIAKAAFTIFFLFICAWTPYAIVTLLGAFGDKRLLTPAATMIPAIACKIVSCMDPWVYAISHPRYRMELEKRLPWIGIRETSVSDNKSVCTEGAETSTTA
ncbi:unnamed protein product [Hermetia illucens]|uniref:G-protein coupled receptors family 1 profile domain-containing protein n=1 Tax=Hermetia illucens TaxID=343691 RepID=A0A7R8US83_HERIL|nr:opsin-3-like [Hermetia illucens]CAD7086067.1 unnamed protein product [Hermetia illucens]